ncbi:baseplate J/gp47 family protein [Laribacter hongkongensis]|uniref:baseplate J/gp47 family protein n=1 Tax=Laribacter hongkongensis TaxID=168471 RepID=UPI001EFDA28D|nr:baseplate J/gp47 family protein [Laribacter hongkongensis]MCG9094469.1 baseplate J/gp47 family protein [Laribacter hongkongensis]
MSDFTVPTLPALVERARRDLSATGDPLRRSDIEVAARAVAGGEHGLYGYLDHVATQSMLVTATDTEWIERHASMWLGPGARRPAVCGTGKARFRGAVGVQIAKGAVLQSSRTGQQYAVRDDAEVPADGVVDVRIAAIETGPASELSGGESLMLVSPQPGVSSDAVALWVSGGTNEETDASLKARTLERIRNPPQGGSAADYITWAMQVPGVTRAWCLPGHLGVGTVAVLFVRDGDDGPLPDATEIGLVQAHVDQLRPVTAELTVMSPVEKPVPYRIRVSPATADVKLAIESALIGLHYRECEPGSPLLRSHVSEAISGARGEHDHELLSPAADVHAGATEMLTFGGVEWVV